MIWSLLLSAALLLLCNSVNTRVGNELGAGNASAARLSVYTCVVIVAAVQSVLVVACKLAERGVVRVLTNNKEVEDLTVATMPVLLPTFVCECQTNCHSPAEVFSHMTHALLVAD